MDQVNKRCYVDINVLQTLPPNCVNRDDTGSPKTGYFGGVIRSRESSQCRKHVIRDNFNKYFPEEWMTIRTKGVVTLVSDAIREMDVSGSIPDKTVDELAANVLTAAGLKIKNKKDGPGALFYTNKGQMKALAEKVLADPAKYKTKKDDKGKKVPIPVEPELEELLFKQPSPPLVMFGRMVATDNKLNYDAAVSVAHAMSTHAVRNEYDYYTAGDDLAKSTSTGAAYLDTTEFNSSTVYRYATINVLELYKYLHEDTPDAVCAFIKEFISSMPTGKQTSFAHRTSPDDAYVTIRLDQPVNLSPAFETPVPMGPNGGYRETSEEALCKYTNRLYNTFLDKPEVALGVGEAMCNLGADVMHVNEMLDVIHDWITKNIVEAGDA